MEKLKKGVGMFLLGLLITLIIVMSAFSREEHSYKQYCKSQGYEYVEIIYHPEYVYAVYCSRPDRILVEELGLINK